MLFMYGRLYRDTDACVVKNRESMLRDEDTHYLIR